MSEDLKRLIDAIETAYIYNTHQAETPYDFISLEVNRRGVRLVFAFRHTDHKNYVLEGKVSWRDIHQAKKGTNPIATELDNLIQQRTEFEA